MGNPLGGFGEFMHGKEEHYTDMPFTLNPITKYAAKRYQRPFFADFNASAYPQLRALANNTLSATQAAAGNPGWGAAADMATKTIQGQYLKANPYLEKSLASSRAALDTDLANTRTATTADLAGQNAELQSQYQRNGQTFSTANQQANQANTAATLARVAEGENSARAGLTANSDQARLQNYLAERENQQNAVGVLGQATSAPLNYLGQAQKTALEPYAAYSNMLTSTYGGQPATPNTAIYNTEGLGDWITSGISSI